MAGGTNVLVVCDGSRGSLTATGRELLALGRSVADALGGAVDFLALGVAADRVAADAAAAGADRICAASDAERAGYFPELFASVVIGACREFAPRVILFSHSALGVDLAPRVAFGLAARWATNCVGVTVEAGVLHCERNEVGGKVRAVEAIEGQAVVTLRPKSVDALAAQPGRQVSTVTLAAAAPLTTGDAIRFVERQLEAGGATAELEQAAVIVSGGLGMGSSAAFEKLQVLAHALGGSLGGSKQAVDRGWISADRQVGLTGTTVAPKLYLAVALSGALQHMAGCQKSKLIVAINKDPTAPIFSFARYGVVANWEEMVPELVARLSSERRDVPQAGPAAAPART